MTIDEHSRHTFSKYGIRGEDIHKWIDGYFDVEGFSQFLQGRFTPGYDPYGHRKFRHCSDALDEVLAEFKGQYTLDQIKNIFETHLKDDYDGYIPVRSDFLMESFLEKYHETKPGLEKEKIFSEKELREYFNKNYYIKKERGKGGFSSFQLKILFPVIIALIFFASSLFILIVPVFRTTMIDGKKEMILELTNTAVSIVDYYDDLSQKGDISLFEAQLAALSEIRKIRYGRYGKDYFWIIDREAKMLMHPYRPDLEGQNLIEYRDPEDPHEQRIFADVVDLVKENGEGYLEYYWQWMDEPNITALKLSYARGVKSWDWIIGTGIYIEDVEEETRGLTLTLLIIFGLAVLASGGILFYVVLQSRRIELDRQRAETGQIEAKERYRALVESSSEAVLLSINGETDFVNNALQQMTGLKESELTNSSPSDWFIPNKELELSGKEFFMMIADHISPGTEYRGVIDESNKRVEVTLRCSRIFLSHSSAILLQFQKIAYSHPVEGFSTSLPISDFSQDITSIFEELKKSESPGEIILLANKMALYLKESMHCGISPRLHRETIGDFHIRVFRRYIELSLDKNSIDDIGSEITDNLTVAFVVLGSSARREMTLFSDQDNAVIFQLSDQYIDKKNPEKVRMRLLKIGQEVCSRLNETGFPLCPGGIMAMNPRWCLNISEWHDLFSKWIKEPDSDALLLFNTFLDMSCVYGDEQLVSGLRRDIILTLQNNPPFLQHFTRNLSAYALPLNSRGKLRAEYVGGEKGIDIKQCLKPLEILVRLYALEQGLVSGGSLRRLERLIEKEKDPERVKGMIELEQILEILWRFRFDNQLRSYSRLERVSDFLALESITSLDLKILTSSLVSLQGQLNEAKVRFLGVGSVL